ncbi:LacI family DNA-binding transcriptional regulator [Bifidobacterium sp. ESL0732]|uniref:LacI family DNA-binding transcriptional regulator n=1 Tax=Bifidobacterium sp. ESL0732 TaxID=2983222 RepID=UPI0023F9E870|nr:LacI family DNA-binding transcriptional regulator [Bifidobacterium sp. ESL0732]WEV63994.1 LacI family DNA-binding transcriptional regulator [Bifidobacterium sp. ESL0732]
MKDVARLAGVSTATVSRYFNSPEKVSEHTRSRLETAINQLNYQPNLIARAFSTGSNHCICVLTDNTTLLGFSSVLGSIMEQAKLLGYALNITLLESDHPATMLDTMHQIELISPEGLILIAFDQIGTAALPYLPSNIPSIAITPDLTDTTLNQISLAAFYGGYSLTTYLLKLGHRTVYHVSVPTNQGGRSRQAGWLLAMQEHHLIAPAPIKATWSPTTGYHIGKQLAAIDDATAIFVGNDEIAIGVIGGLQDAGKKIPEDVSVVGFDDHPLAQVIVPQLTTYHMRFADAGKRAITSLHELITGGAKSKTAEPLKLELRGNVILRKSAQAPR